MVVRVYWPINVLETEKSMGQRPAIIVGWNNNNTDLVVVATLPYLEPSFVEQLLENDRLLSSALNGKGGSSSGTMSNSSSSASLNPRTTLKAKHGLPPLSVLGTLNATDELAPQFPAFSSRVYLRATLAHDSKYPVHEFYSFADNVGVSFESSYISALRTKHRRKQSKHAHTKSRSSSSIQDFADTSSDKAFQVLLFRPPTAKKMQYFSLHPIGLALEEKSSLELVDEEYEKNLLIEKDIENVLTANAGLQSVKDRSHCANQGNTLNDCVTQMNCSGELGHVLKSNCDRLFPQLAEQQRQYLVQQRRNRRSMSQSMIQSAQTVNKGLFYVISMLWQSFIPICRKCCMWLIILGRVAAELILRIVDWRPLPFLSFKDMSATAQQIDLRLQQYCFWPLQYNRIRNRLASDSWPLNIPAGNIEYIRFYNSIWLVANDVILGIAMCGLILDNEQAILAHLDIVLNKLLTEQPRMSILWLMGWPGGLKLNTELAMFLGELFLWVIEFWSQLLNSLQAIFPTILRILAYSGFLGVTFTISMICDLISFCTIHCYATYLASARLFRYQLLSLYSLSLLFRGKKRNVLRNRIDSCNYELDQLLVGTIFLMLQLFLLPTVMVFYSFFAFCRLSIVVVCAALESILACLNHFPLFAILLRIKDSHRIPGGIQFSFIESSADGSQSYVELTSVPLAFSHIFKSYRTLGHRLRMHYLSFGVVTRIMTGQFVPIRRSKLYGLLYSMLPMHRPSISTVLDELRTWM